MSNRSQTYQLGLLAFALLGFGFLFLVIIAQVFLLVLAISFARSSGSFQDVAIALVVAPVLLWGIYHLIRAYVADFPPPDGVELDESVPLVAEIRRLERSLGTRRMDKILLTEEFNAAAAVLPRFLPWGHKAYVIVGVPLMAALSADELRGVLAHELAHHSRKHTRFANWIYRVRLTWPSICDAFDSLPGVLQHLVVRFYDWYIPEFQRYTLELARDDEYEADSLAVDEVGPDALASCLCRIATLADWVQFKVWPKVNKLAQKHALPPNGVIAKIAQEIGQLDDQRLAELFSTIDYQRTGPGDTHPCLLDRLASIDSYPRAPRALLADSGLALLGDRSNEIIASVDGYWRGVVKDEWAQTHRRWNTLALRYDHLRKAVEGRNIERHELLELATISREMGRPKQAFAWNRQLCRDHDNSNAALIECGMIQLELGDQRGVAAIQKGLSMSPINEPDGYVALIEHFCREGATTLAERYRVELCKSQAALDERMGLYDDQTDEPWPMLPAMLRDDHRQGLAAWLRTIRSIRGAAIVRLDVPLMPHWPAYTIFLDLVSGGLTDELVERVNRGISLAGSVVLFEAREEPEDYAHACGIEGARLF